MHKKDMDIDFYLDLPIWYALKVIKSMADMENEINSQMNVPKVNKKGKIMGNSRTANSGNAVTDPAQVVNFLKS